MPNKRRQLLSAEDLNRQLQIIELAWRERRLQLELQDVFTDITTPPDSDDEDEDNNAEPRQLHTEAGRQLRENLLASLREPSPQTPYACLYACPDYEHNSRKKMRLLI
ncbi:hypothetical protein DAPPUDRAFT_342935, partial [Daphnia pulex]